MFVHKNTKYMQFMKDVLKVRQIGGVVVMKARLVLAQKKRSLDLHLHSLLPLTLLLGLNCGITSGVVITLSLFGVITLVWFDFFAGL